MDVLFPPVLESQGLGFDYVSQNVDQKRYDIRFALPLGTSPESIGHVQVSIKDLNTGSPAVSSVLSPDKQVLYISASSSYFIDNGDGNYTLRIPYRAWINGAPAANTTYCIQVRFGSTGLWDRAGTGLDGGGFNNFAAWRIACTSAIPSTFGEWSNILKAYCGKRASPVLSVDFHDFMPRLGWTYRAPQGSDDSVEQIKVTYWFSTVHGVETKTDVFTGQYQNDNNYSFTTILPVAPVKDIQVSVEAVTKNNMKYHNEGYITSLIKSNTIIETPNGMGKMSDTEMSASEQEDGCIGKQVKVPSNLTYEVDPTDPETEIEECKLFNVYRIETLTTKCVKIISN